MDIGYELSRLFNGSFDLYLYVVTLEYGGLKHRMSKLRI